MIPARCLRRAALLALPLVLAGRPLAAQDADTTVRRLSLPEALELAEGRSEAVGIARADVTRARGDRRRARSGYFPQLSGSASYQRTLRSQFSALEQANGDTTSAPSTSQCDRFVAQPGLTVEQRLDSLENSVECASAEDPFANFRNLPFGRRTPTASACPPRRTCSPVARLRGQSQSADAGVRSAQLGVTAAQAQTAARRRPGLLRRHAWRPPPGIAEATLEQADTTLSQTTLAEQVGNQSEFELLRARVTRDNQRPVVIQRRAERDLAYCVSSSYWNCRCPSRSPSPQVWAIRLWPRIPGWSN